MTFKQQIFIQRTRWLLPLLLAILLVSSCQFVPKRHYQEAETKSTLAQRSAARQAGKFQQLKEENTELEAANAALRDELGGLGIVVEQIKAVRQKEKALTQKTIMALKKEKGVLQQRFIALQKKYTASRRKKIEPIKKTRRVILPKKSAPRPEPEPSAKPLSAPKREEGGRDNNLAIEKPQPKAPSQLEAKLATVPTEMHSFVQETNLPRHKDEKDHKQTQIHKEQPTNTRPQNTSPISASAGTRIDVNTRTAEDIMTHLGISADIAKRIVANRPYRFPAEVVLKGAVTKKTYNKIKDKIFAEP